MRKLSRRAAMFWALGIPAAVRAATNAKEFWDAKFPEDWSPEEIKRLLSNSPWAQPAAIHFDNGPGGAGGFSPGGYMAPGDRVMYEGTGAAKNPGATFHAVVRWDSAKPVCAANKGTPDGASQFYMLSLIGDFPEDAKPADGDNSSALIQRQEMLRAYTKLERKGDGPIYLERIQSIPGGDLFYFPRLDKITPANKDITFSTRLGPLEFKAKFALKDMMYRGKLEL